MEHEVRAAEPGRVREVLVRAGRRRARRRGAAATSNPSGDAAAAEAGPRRGRPRRHPRRPGRGARPPRRHARRRRAPRPSPAAGRPGQRTARENVADLVDPGTFVEYGPLAVAAQRRRRTLEDLIAKQPGRRHGHRRRPRQRRPVRRSGGPRCAVMAYDYTVFAGTQGVRNHAKTDRLIDVAEQGRCRSCCSPKAVAAGRATTTTATSSAATRSASFGQLSGPGADGRHRLRATASPATRRCSAAATSSSPPRNSNIGMGGPAMIEGGGLGVYRPEEIGPDRRAASPTASSTSPSPTRPRRVARGQAATSPTSRAACRLGRRPTSGAARIVPENRLRVYDVRTRHRHARRRRLRARAAPRTSAAAWSRR